MLKAEQNLLFLFNDASLLKILLQTWMMFVFKSRNIVFLYSLSRKQEIGEVYDLSNFPVVWHCKKCKRNLSYLHIIKEGAPIAI